MKVVKLKKTDDIAAVIQIVKDLKDREVVFELEKGSPLLVSSNNLRLIKKTGEVLGKKIRVRTDDPTGRILALKAEILDGEVIQPNTLMPMPSKVKRSDVKPMGLDSSLKRGGRFSDIVRPKTPAMSAAVAAVKAAQAKIPAQTPYANSSMEIQTHSKPARVRTGTSFSKVFVVTMVVLVLVVFGLAVLLPKANITVYARSEPITRDVEVVVDRTVANVDGAKFAVPAQTISREVSQTKNFSATGSKNVGTKASGTVQLYNFTKNTLTLRATTTVLLVEGKRFLFTKDVTGLRPTAIIGTGDEQEVDPSSLIPPTAIIAESPGSEFNVVANTKFNIVNAALGNQNVYGVNLQTLSGGTSRVVKVVSQEDLDNAAASMTNSIAQTAEADLNAENATGDLKILPTGITKEVLAKTANKNAGDEAEAFDMTMIAKISGLAFKESDVKDLIKQKISLVLSEDKYLLTDAKDEVLAHFKSLDLPNGKGVLSVHYETVAAYKVDSENMPQLLAGKTANEIKEILLTKPEIDRVDVEFAPFFVNKAPKLNGKIYIHNKLSQ